MLKESRFNFDVFQNGKQCVVFSLRYEGSKVIEYTLFHTRRFSFFVMSIHMTKILCTCVVRNDYGTYTRWKLRTCCAHMKENRGFLEENFRLVTDIELSKWKNRSNNRDHFTREHLYLSYHIIPWTRHSSMGGKLIFLFSVPETFEWILPHLDFTGNFTAFTNIPIYTLEIYTKSTIIYENIRKTYAWNIRYRSQ